MRTVNISQCQCQLLLIYLFMLFFFRLLKCCNINCFWIISKTKKIVSKELEFGTLSKLWNNRHLSWSQILSADENKVRVSWMAPGMWSVWKGSLNQKNLSQDRFPGYKAGFLGIMRIGNGSGPNIWLKISNMFMFCHPFDPTVTHLVNNKRCTVKE